MNFATAFQALARTALLTSLIATSLLANAKREKQLLLDIENMQMTSFDQRGMNSLKLTQAEKLEYPAALKQAKQHDLAFLRCESTRKNFGASFPINLPDFEAAFVEKSSDAPGMPRIRVWRGVQGLLHMDVGYGFFSVLQYYSADQKNALLREIEAAGWKDTGTTNFGVQVESIQKTVIRVFEKADQSGPVLRKLHLIEEQVFTDLKFPRRSGLTLSCVSTVIKP